MTTFGTPRIQAGPTSQPERPNPAHRRRIGDRPKPGEGMPPNPAEDPSQPRLDPIQGPRHNAREKVSEPVKPGFKPLPAQDPIPRMLEQ